MATNEEAVPTTDHEVAPPEAWDAIAEEYDRSSRPARHRSPTEGLRLAGLTGRAVPRCRRRTGRSEPAGSASRRQGAGDGLVAGDDRTVRGACPRRRTSNAESGVMDAHALDIGDDSFDVTGSQFGVMLVPDQPLALARWSV